MKTVLPTRLEDKLTFSTKKIMMTITKELVKGTKDDGDIYFKEYIGNTRELEIWSDDKLMFSGHTQNEMFEKSFMPMLKTYLCKCAK